MGLLRGHALQVARRLHGPASVIWIVLIGVHVLVYVRRAVIESTGDVTAATREAVDAAKWRASALAIAVISGLLIAAATVPAQHDWVELPRDHHHDRQAALAR
jgi:hypothetical protein